MGQVSHLLAVEADGGGGVHVLVELEPVEDGRLAAEVEAQHGAVERGEAGDVLCERM